MNIVHVIHTVGAASYGPGQVVLHLAREQGTLGGRARIWCLAGEEERQWAADEIGCSAEIEGFPLSFPRALRISRAMERKAGREAAGISVVHLHALWTGLSRTSSFLSSRREVPSVVSPHGALESWALKKSWWKKRIALTLYERRNLQGASCLHACSDQEVAGFREFGLKNPVAVIRNGIDQSWLESAGDAGRFREKFAIPAGKRILLYLSRITPVKGLPLLIDALSGLGRHLGDWTLVMAGGDEFGHLREVQEMIGRHRLESRVVFTGLITGQLKRDAFAAAELFVLPTRREAAPMVVLEALGAGVPVVTTKGAPWADLAQHRCGWWTDVEADAIRAALDVAMGMEPEELGRMGARGKELVAGKYSWATSAGMTMELYEWLQEKRDRPEFVI